MTPSERPHRALLIGIDVYAAGKVQGQAIQPLRGAVRDVTGLRDVLVELGMSRADVQMLVSPPSPECPVAERPTYAVLVRDLAALLESAAEDDRLLFYFSGHGMRVAVSEVDGPGHGETEEALAPWDVAAPGGRPLLKRELASFAQAAAARGVHLTLILDCCFAPTLLRQSDLPEGAVVRSLAGVGKAPRATRAPWQRYLEEQAPGELAGKNLVRLAACGAGQQAFELPFGSGSYGVFTHALLRCLPTALGGSWQGLLDRIQVEVEDRVVGQTPELEGERWRRVFAPGWARPDIGARICAHDPAQGRLLLHAGTCQGLARGDRLSITGPGAESIEVEVTHPGATRSWGQVQGSLPPGWDPREHRVPLTGLARPLRLGVSPPLEPSSPWLTALQARRSSCFTLVPLGDTADLWLGQTPGGLVLLDDEGVPLPNLSALPGPPEAVAPELVRCLDQLALYRRLAELPAPRGRSRLMGRPLLTLIHEDCGELLWNGNLGAAGTLPLLSLPAGARLRLRLEVPEGGHFYVALLDLKPTWGIEQVVPSRKSGRRFEELRPRQALERVLTAELAAGATPAPEQLLLYVTQRPPDFRWLERPPLDPRFEAPAELGWSPLRRGEQAEPDPATSWVLARLPIEVRP